jgi:hypothetical protein
MSALVQPNHGRQRDRWKAGATSLPSSINDKRFIELQRACGAFQGHIKPPNHNQLLDAFHIWCAEFAGCSYFLTLDFKLMRVLSKSKAKTQLRLVRPSELLFEVQRNGEQ